MKHIFVVHSNITYLSALGIIAHDNLALPDCLLVSGHYLRDAPIAVNRIKLFSLNLLRPARFFNFAYDVDRKIANFTGGEQFTAYVPTVCRLEKVVVTNPLCAEICFFEEGIGSYFLQFPFDNHVYDDRNGFLRPKFSWRYIKDTFFAVANLIRGDSQRLHSMPQNYNCYVNGICRRFYGFNKAVFPLCDAPTVINFSAIADRFTFESTVDLSGECVLIGEGLFSLAEGYSVEQYMGILRDIVLPWVTERGVKHVMWKPHYNENEASRAGTLDVFRGTDIAITQIPDNVILEIALLQSHDTRVVGCTSSLLFYGALMGLECYSYHDRAALPALNIPIYWEQVKNI